MCTTLSRQKHCATLKRLIIYEEMILSVFESISLKNPIFWHTFNYSLPSPPGIQQFLKAAFIDHWYKIQHVP